MGSRIPSYKVVDYCFNPIHVYDKDMDKDIIVPCGKCDGCLLHKANEWSMRCGMEIEDTPATIFGTLTYDNKYLPKLYPLRNVQNVVLWTSYHKENVRFNSVCDVRREDNFIIGSDKNYLNVDIQNWDNVNRPSIAYFSKRDFQLWLKLLRKDLYDKGCFKTSEYDKRGFFRYYAISEIGPTTHRPHVHYLLFCASSEIASYLLECGLYKNWKMCDEVRFRKYTSICNSGTRNYVTQYLTCYSGLPKVYRENKEIRPFRLASKSPAIGFIGQDKAKIYEDIAKGVIDYSRPIHRLESNSLLQYPAGLLSRLFPKCYRYYKTDDRGRFAIYRYVYGEVRENGKLYTDVLRGLSQSMHAQDVLASCACFRFCGEFVDSPEYYYYLLDTYYYKLDMSRLKSFYESQEKQDFSKTPELIFEYYPNIEQIILNYKDSYSLYLSVCVLFSSLGLDINDYSSKDVFVRIHDDIVRRNFPYIADVKDKVSEMEKVPKYNELTGKSPTIV